MGKDDELLSRFSVVSPCPISLPDMTGEDKLRFCQHCSKNVHNLSNMSKKEAAKVIRQSDLIPHEQWCHYKWLHFTY